MAMAARNAQAPSASATRAAVNHKYHKALAESDAHAETPEV